MISKKGAAAIDVILFAAISIFVIFPLFSFVIEKYVLSVKAQLIKDAADITNLAAYNAIQANNLGSGRIDLDMDKVEEIYSELLAKNLCLNDDLSPRHNSVAEGVVAVKSLAVYTDGFPHTCPYGTAIEKPGIHSVITVPVKPMLYRQIILGMLGKEIIELDVHVDSEVPLNN